MTQPLKTFLKYLFSGLVTVSFLYLAFRGTDFARLVELMEGANYWWVCLTVALLITSHLLRSWRWRYLLEPIRSGIGMRNLFSGVMIGYFMNNLLPRAGELVRPYSLAKLESLPKSAVFGTIVVERIMDTITFLVLLLVLPIVYNGPLRESFPWLERTGMITAAVTVGLLGFFIMLVFRRDLADRLLGTTVHFFPERIGKKLDRIMHSFLDGFLFVKRPANFLRILILSCLVWLLYMLMLYAAFWAFDLQNLLGFRAALVLLTISSIGFAVPTPGGTGAYHFFASQTLVKLFSIPDAVAISYATVTHAATYIGVTVVGLYYLLHDHIKVSDAVAKPEEQSG